MIIGVDPGTRNVAFAVLDADGSFVACGLLEIGARGGEGVSPQLFDDLLFALTIYVAGDLPADVVACERPFVGDNKKLVVELGRVMGMVQAVAVVLKMRFLEIAPKAARKALTGSGDADDSTAYAFAADYTRRRDLSIHECDALGVALAAWELLHPGGGEGGE